MNRMAAVVVSLGFHIVISTLWLLDETQESQHFYSCHSYNKRSKEIFTPTEKKNSEGKIL